MSANRNSQDDSKKLRELLKERDRVMSLLEQQRQRQEKTLAQFHALTHDLGKIAPMETITVVRIGRKTFALTRLNGLGELKIEEANVA